MTAGTHGEFRAVGTGLRCRKSLPEIIAWLTEQGRGKAEVNFRLRDWLVSRQRYWGTPIPVVYCDNCGMMPCR